MSESIEGILLKTQPKYAKTFIEHWKKEKKPQVFCIFDRKPVLKEGNCIFVYINQINKLGFMAKFIKSSQIKGFKKLESSDTRISEREKIWSLFGNGQLHTDNKSEFDEFWEQQDGVRSFVMMDNLIEIEKTIRWNEIRKIVYTNYPRGMGYLYLTNKEIEKLKELIEVRI